jgi:hypothetical protein
METYWAKQNNNNNADIAGPSVRPPAPHSKAKTALGYVNLGLPANLNITADDEMVWGETSFDTQSIEDEYHSYGSGVLTKIDVNILKFWEVCHSFTVGCSSWN